MFQLVWNWRSMKLLNKWFWCASPDLIQFFHFTDEDMRPRWEVSKVRLFNFKTSLLPTIQCCQKIGSAWKVAKPHLSNVLNNFLKALTPSQLDPNDRNCVTVAQSPLYCPPIEDERKFPRCPWPADITTTLISASLHVRGRGCREAVVQDWGLRMTGVSLQCFTLLSVGEEK